jgi:hypothetical protein
MKISSSMYQDTTTLSQKLAAAVAEYKDNMLRGLNGMCDEEKAARIAEFKAKHKPIDGTEEEMAAFYEKLAAFKKMLYTIADREQAESLITVGGSPQEESEGIPGQARNDAPRTLGNAEWLGQQVLQTQAASGLVQSYDRMTASM